MPPFAPRHTLLAVALCTSACIGFPAHDDSLPLTRWAQSCGARRARVDAGRYIGISDLAPGRDPNGAPAYYLFPERQRALLQLDPPWPNANDLTQAPLRARAELRSVEGVPVDHDTEALAFLPDGRFVLGTETPWPNRSHDDVLVVQRRGHGASVVARWPFAYAPFGLRGQSNQGLEGLCVAGNSLLVASETAGKAPDGSRYAPLGLRRLQGTTGGFVPLRLPLSSATGKVSALACRAVDDGRLEVLAIERHYGVGRVVRTFVPVDAAPFAPLQAQVVVDLTELMPRLPNYEGIAWLDGGDVLLITDNSMGFATGPTEVLLLPQRLFAQKEDHGAQSP